MSLLTRITVLTAVQLNSQFCLFAEKIQIILPYRMLSPKFIAAKTPIPQPAPDKLFRPGFFFAKLAGTSDYCHERIVLHPSKNKISF